LGVDDLNPDFVEVFLVKSIKLEETLNFAKHFEVNFSTIVACVEAETGEDPFQDVLKTVLHHLSEVYQDTKTHIIAGLRSL